MSWDTTACFKSLCTAYAEFQQNHNEQTILNLQRQIDVLLGVTSLGGSSLKDYSPKLLIYAESLSALVSVINEPNLKNAIYLKALTALTQLSNDMETRVTLQQTFNLGSSLANFILRNSISSNKPLILQSLNLLQKMTYGADCHIPVIFLGDLIRHLVKLIQSPSSYCLSSMSILANLCRRNQSVQVFIKNMDDVKPFYRHLFKYLSHSDKSYSIVSLSILTNLVLNEDVGEKVFHGNNLINIIQLVFNVLITMEDLMFRQYAVDLLIDLMDSERIFKVVTENPSFNTFIYKMLSMLHSTDANTVIKILELLISFCGKQESQIKVMDVFIKKCQFDEETQLPDETSLLPSQALLHWISRADTDDSTVQANLLSMVFLREILTGTVSLNAYGHLSPYINQFMPLLLDGIYFNVTTDNSKVLKQRCRKVTCIFEIFLMLCKIETIKANIASKLDIKNLLYIIHNIYDTFSEDLKGLRDSTVECSQEIVFLLFRALELLSTLKHDIESGQEKYTSVIQDGKIIPFLSYGITCKTKYLVHATLQIYAEAIKMRDFPIKSFGDVISAHNLSRYNQMVSLKSKQLEDTPSQRPVHVPITNPLRDVTNMKTRDSTNMTILAEKLKKGLELKDTKLSDIMDFYEHKLASLTGRETHLVDLLEAKNAALVQSDRLLGQYRCRHAQSEAECLTLRSMLQQSEKKLEADTLKMEDFTKTKMTLMEQISNLQKQLKVLESVAMEHKELCELFQEQSQKLESVQKSLVASEEEHHSLAAMNECLHKNSEKLKSKLECANERIKLLEDEENQLALQIKDRDVKISSLKKSLEFGESTIQTQRHERSQLEKRYEDLDKELKKLDRCYKEAKHQISSLELVRQQHEQVIKEKEELITNLHGQMEKQEQIAAMIHNLTSGKINVSKMS